MEHKIAIKEPGKPLEIRTCEGTYRTDVRPFIDSGNDTYLQFVQIRSQKDRVLCFACDEDGIRKALPANFQMLTRSGNHSFFETILGTVVFLVFRWEDPYEKEIYDFELMDLNDDDIAIVEKLLSAQTQEKSRLVAEIDPNVHTDGHLFFEPIKDLNEYLFSSPSPLANIPSFLVASYLFTEWPVNEPLSFYVDQKGKVMYTTGIKGAPFNRKLEIYCECAQLAHAFSLPIEITADGISEESAIDLMKKYMDMLHQWGVPGFVYITKETEKRIKSN